MEPTMTDQMDPPTFTIEDVRRVMDLAALLAFVAAQRGAAEYDRRVTAGLAMPKDLTTPREKASFLERLDSDFRYDGHAYALDEITDDEIAEYLASPAQPTLPGWLHKLTGPPPQERTKPWVPTDPRFGAPPPPPRPQKEGPPVRMYARDDPDNPYRAQREVVRPHRQQPDTPHLEDTPAPEPAETGLRRIVRRRVTKGDQP